MLNEPVTGASAIDAVRRNRANSIPAAAQRLGISEATLWRRIKDKSVRAVKISAGRTVITDAEIDRLLTPAA